MTDDPSLAAGNLDALSEHQLLLLLDLATEVVEGLDQLGVACRDEVEALMSRIERRIDDQD